MKEELELKQRVEVH